MDQTGIGGPSDLPPGKHTINTWHEKLKTKRQTAVLPGQGGVTVQIDLTKRAQLAHCISKPC